MLEQHLKVLEIINLNLKSKDMVVLGALLKAQSDSTAFVDFGSLRDQLAKEEGGRRGSDPLIYRSLSWLENSGLIQLDRSSQKHGYNSNVGLLHNVVKRLIKEKSSDLIGELQSIDTDINFLSETDFDLVSTDLVRIATGEQPTDQPIFAEGWHNILKLLDDKVYKNLKKNDIIRFTLEWYDRPEHLENPRLSMIESLLKAGIEIRAVEHRNSEKKSFSRLAQKYDFYRQAGYKVGFRVCLRGDSTYQFVGRNSEGILLIVSENPLSATWLPRRANKELVDSAIQSFDRDYAEGQDISSIGGQF